MAEGDAQGPSKRAVKFHDKHPSPPENVFTFFDIDKCFYRSHISKYTWSSICNYSYSEFKAKSLWKDSNWHCCSGPESFQDTDGNCFQFLISLTRLHLL